MGPSKFPPKSKMRWNLILNCIEMMHLKVKISYFFFCSGGNFMLFAKRGLIQKQKLIKQNFRCTGMYYFGPLLQVNSERLIKTKPNERGEPVNGR